MKKLILLLFTVSLISAQAADPVYPTITITGTATLPANTTVGGISVATTTGTTSFALASGSAAISGSAIQAGTAITSGSSTVSGTAAIALSLSATSQLVPANAPFLPAVALSGTFADLLGKPTTLGGYGITDALLSTGSIAYSGTSGVALSGSSGEFGSAAFTAASNYATAAQGTTANNALTAMSSYGISGADGLVDSDSIVLGDVSSPFWNLAMEIAGLGLKSTPNYSYDPTFGYMTYLNSGSSGGFSMIQVINVPVGTTAITATFAAGLPADRTSTTLQAAFGTPGTGTVYSGTSIVLSATTQQYSVTYANPPTNTEFVFFFGVNGGLATYGGQALVNRPKITLTGTTTLFPSPSFNHVQIDKRLVNDSLRTHLKSGGNNRSTLLSSPFSTTNLVTTATTMTLGAVISSTSSSLQVFVNGAPWQLIQPTSLDYLYAKVPLPEGEKEVSIQTGIQFLSTIYAGSGMLLREIFLPTASKTQFRSTMKNRRVAFYGDSITESSSATNPMTQGFSVLLRTMTDYQIALDCWGSRSLHYDAVSQDTECSMLIESLRVYKPDYVFVMIGTNDYGMSTMAAATFGTHYSALLDNIHAVAPTCKVYALSMFPRSVETANTFGDTLDSYRAQVVTAVSTRTAYATVLSGTSVLNLADTEGLHPTTKGNQKLAKAIYDLIK